MGKPNNFSGKWIGTHGTHVYKKNSELLLQLAFNFVLEFVDHWHVQVMSIKLFTSFRIVAGKWT